jgi:hypothetical protein
MPLQPHQVTSAEPEQLPEEEHAVASVRAADVRCRQAKAEAKVLLIAERLFTTRPRPAPPTTLFANDSTRRA